VGRLVTRIVLIRHGTADAGGRAYGQRFDPGLAHTGGLELDALRARWGLEEVAAVLCSPTRRTRESAERLGLPVDRVEPRWLERDLGAWEGRLWEELWREAPPEVTTDPAAYADFTPPEGEPVRQLRVRVAAALTELAEEHPTTDPLAVAPVVVVTHGGVVNAAVAHVLDLDTATSLRVRVATASATWLTRFPGGHWTLDRLAA
jgi:alpha-ribazole phosphatase